MKKTNAKVFLMGALGHLVCWLGGDLLLYFQKAGKLDVNGLFDYQKTVAMLEGASTLQLTLSGVFGVVAMMLALPGYLAIARFLAKQSKKAERIVQVGAVLTCVSGAVMHFTCTGMLWHFVMAGATEQAHSIMLRFFFETAATTALCMIGVMLVSITLFVMVFRRKTCLPKIACLVNTLPLTMAAGLFLAGVGAMNVGSCLMFAGLYLLIKKYGE